MGDSGVSINFAEYKEDLNRIFKINEDVAKIMSDVAVHTKTQTELLNTLVSQAGNIYSTAGSILRPETPRPRSQMNSAIPLLSSPGVATGNAAARSGPIAVDASSSLLSG